MNVLRSKIRDGKAVIGIIGLGYVGLPLAIRFVKEGFETIGFDIDDQKIKSLLNSKSYINHIGNQEVEFLIKNKFKPTSDFSFISSLDVIIICVEVESLYRMTIYENFNNRSFFQRNLHSNTVA